MPFMAKDSIKLSVGLIRSFLAVPSKSGHLPTDRDCMRFLMLCKSRGLNPWEGDAFLVGYETDGVPNFSLITAVQAFFKRAEVHPEYDGLESGVIVETRTGEIIDRIGDFYHPDDKHLLGGWATVHFKNRKIPMRARLDLKTFSTGYSRWKKDPAGMIVKCAEADALRRAFPTSLGGMYLEGEIGEVIEQQPTVVEPPPERGRVDMRADRFPVKGNGSSHVKEGEPAAVAVQPSEIETVAPVVASRVPPEAPTPPTSSPENLLLKESIANEIEKNIDAGEFDQAGLLMLKCRADLGEELYGRIEKYYHQQFKESQKKNKKGGR